MSHPQRLRPATLLRPTCPAIRDFWSASHLCSSWSQTIQSCRCGVQALHHPFTAPRFPAGSNGSTDLASAGSWAYDLVFNGFEIGGAPCSKPPVLNTPCSLVGLLDPCPAGNAYHSPTATQNFPSGEPSDSVLAVCSVCACTALQSTPFAIGHAAAGLLQCTAGRAALRSLLMTCSAALEAGALPAPACQARMLASWCRIQSSDVTFSTMHLLVMLGQVG